MDSTQKISEQDIIKNIEIYSKEDWENIIINQILSDTFMRKYHEYFTNNNLWTLLTKNQIFTKEFLNDFADKIDWSVVSSKRISCKMLDSFENVNIKQKMSVKISGDLSAFDDEQLQVLYDGLAYNEECTKTNDISIDIMEYANPQLSAKEMKEIKNKLINYTKENKNDYLSIDDIINGNTNQETEEIKPQEKKKERNLETNYGQIKLISKGVYEYPRKIKEVYEEVDNIFGECNVFDE